jgi:hypothetical protein
MSSVKIALGAGFTLIAVAILLTLSQSPMSVAATNKLAGHTEEGIASTTTSATYCQGRETLPRGSSAIRIWLDAATGPRVSVAVYSAAHKITSGTRGSDWIGGSVTIPVRPLARNVSPVTVCVSFQLRDETIIVQGNPTPANIAARDGQRALGGRIWIEYLRAGSHSWASLIPQIIRHMGFGRATSGTWIVYVALLLLAGVAGAASNLLLKELS